MLITLAADHFLNLSKSLSFQLHKFKFELIPTIKTISSLKYLINIGTSLTVSSNQIINKELDQSLHSILLNQEVVEVKDPRDQALIYNQKLTSQKLHLFTALNHLVKAKLI